MFENILDHIQHNAKRAPFKLKIKEGVEITPQALSNIITYFVKECKVTFSNVECAPSAHTVQEACGNDKERINQLPAPPPQIITKLPSYIPPQGLYYIVEEAQAEQAVDGKGEEDSLTNQP